MQYGLKPVAVSATHSHSTSSIDTRVVWAQNVILNKPPTVLNGKYMLYLKPSYT